MLSLVLSIDLVSQNCFFLWTALVDTDRLYVFDRFSYFIVIKIRNTLPVNIKKINVKPESVQGLGFSSHLETNTPFTWKILTETLHKKQMSFLRIKLHSVMYKYNEYQQTEVTI